MSFKEVKELRVAGSLEEALKMAEKDLENNPESIWNKRSVAWVYYELLKKHAVEVSFHEFKEYLIKLKELNLAGEEGLIFDTVAYQVGKVIYAIAKAEPVNYSAINDLFNIIKDFHFSKPSASYSFLYKAFHQVNKEWSNYLEFADWWAFDNFDTKDYLNEEYNGKSIMSLVEKAYVAYGKKLLEDIVAGADGFSQVGVSGREKIEQFLPKLNELIQKHPEYQYPLYYKTKLLLAIDDRENALTSFLPFAKMKRNDFWVWDLMSDIFPEDDDRKIACLCKALTLRTRENFLINVHKKLGLLLADKGLYSEAKTEIEKVIELRRENAWRIPSDITEITEKSWYKDVSGYDSNKAFYKKFLPIAEEILYHDIREEVVAVEYVNYNKHFLNFVKNKTKHGFLKYEGLIDKVSIGDLLSIRFDGKGEDKYFKALTIKKLSGDIESEAVKQFEGVARINESANFGFVDNVFVEPKLVKSFGLGQGQQVTGEAILSFNKKKNDWGWKALRINQ